MKKIALICTTLVLFSCGYLETSAEKQNIKPLKSELQFIENDSLMNISQNDTLLYSYFVKNMRPSGLFQSYKHGKIFSKGLMTDSLKNGVWKFFDQDGILDSVVHYNNGRRTYFLDRNDFIYKSTQLESARIKVDVPMTWTLQENYEGAIFILYKNVVENGFKSNITLVHDRESKLPFEKYCKEAFTLIIKKFSNVRIIEDKKVIISNHEGKQLTFTGNISGVMTGNIIVILEHTDGNYIFTAGAGNTEKGDFLRSKGLSEELIYNVNFW